jgi:hypothetical protein
MGFVCVFDRTECAECACCAGTPVAQVAALVALADAQRLREAGLAVAREGWIVPLRGGGELPDWRVCDGEIPPQLADIRVRILSTSAAEVEIGINELEAFIASLPE